MKPSTILLTAFVLGALALIIYSFNAGLSPDEYKAQLAKEREEKDLYMRNSDESPFAENKEALRPLNYFAPNLAYKVNAKLVEIPSKKMVLLGTSSGEEDRYLEYAFAEFELNGKQNKLLILELVAPGESKGTLFLAFADNTSANETYGAGRYLDVKKVPGSTSIMLDFNKAYNPYCAYNNNFTCPFPPKENFLKISIYAGEKKYDQ
jgi:uncharacterized protein